MRTSRACARSRPASVRRSGSSSSASRASSAGRLDPFILRGARERRATIGSDMPFRLRYLAHDLELPIGEFVVGRSTDCQLSLDDPLVSRRHAVLRVRRDGVSVQDLGSRNGVVVNGTKISGERELAGGDKVAIGSQEMVLTLSAEARPAANEDVYRRATQTLGAAYVSDLRAVVDGLVGQGAARTPPDTSGAGEKVRKDTPQGATPISANEAGAKP